MSDSKPITDSIRPKTGAPTRRKQVKTGVVVSRSMDKTAVVRVTKKMAHPLYGKTIIKSRKFMAHDERNECVIGDKVIIQETRPLSRWKRWRVVKLLDRRVLPGTP